MTYRIAVDLDDVVFDFVPYFIKFTNGLYGHADNPDNIDDWNWWDCKWINLSLKEFLYAMDLFTQADLWRTIPLFPNVLPHLWDLQNKGAELVYLTDRPSESATSSAIHQAHLPSAHSLHYCKAKEKAQFCQDNDINMIIEDKFETVIDCATVGIESVLMFRTHNEQRWRSMLKKCIDQKEKIYEDKRGNMHIKQEWIDNIKTVRSFKVFADIVRRNLCAGVQGDSE